MKKGISLIMTIIIVLVTVIIICGVWFVATNFASNGGNVNFGDSNLTNKEEYIVIREEGLSRLYDESGKKAGELKEKGMYMSSKNFYSGGYLVYEENRNYSIVDLYGKEVYKAKKDEIITKVGLDAYSLEVYKDYELIETKLIDHKGKVLVKSDNYVEFESMGSYEYLNIIKVKDKNGNYGIITQDGKNILDAKYTNINSARAYKQGLYVFEADGTEYAFLESQGKLVLKDEQKIVAYESYNNDSYAFVVTKNNDIYSCSKKDFKKISVPEQFEKYNSFMLLGNKYAAIKFKDNKNANYVMFYDIENDKIMHNIKSSSIDYDTNVQGEKSPIISCDITDNNSILIITPYMTKEYSNSQYNVYIVNDGYYYVMEKNSKTTLYNIKGEEIANTSNISEGYKFKVISVIEKNNTLSIVWQYFVSEENSTNSKYSLALKRYMVTDKSLNVILKDDDISNMWAIGNFIAVNNSKKTTDVYTANGEKVLENYEGAYKLINSKKFANSILIKQNGKYGIYDGEKKKITIEPKYSKINTILSNNINYIVVEDDTAKEYYSTSFSKFQN